MISMKEFYLSIVELANKVAKVPFAKSLLKPIYYPFKKKIEKLNSSSFRSNALEVLECFDKALTSNGIDYCLAFGTMLGAVREKGFIKHDQDIDVLMWKEDYSEKLNECLSSVGFKRIHCFLVEDGTLGREETYEKDGVSIDIFYIYPAFNKIPYCCDFVNYGDAPTLRASMKKYGRVLPRRIEIPIKKSFTRVPFEHLMLPIPVNANEYLECRYGKSYMIPNPDWTIDSYDNFIIKWPDVFAVYNH